MAAATSIRSAVTCIANTRFGGPCDLLCVLATYLALSLCATCGSFVCAECQLALSVLAGLHCLHAYMAGDH